MTRDLAELRAVRGVLFDLDGVIYHAKGPLPGVRDAIDYLKSTGRAFPAVTNNPTLTSEQFVARLAQMEIHDVCHTCKCGLISGAVEYDPGPFGPPAAGNVLICCSRPQGELVIDS